MSQDLIYFNPWTEITITGNNLPHWEQPGVTYFLTFRLGDSISFALRQSWSEQRDIWLRLHPQPWSPEVEADYHKHFSQQIEDWLDAGNGACVFREPSVRAIMEECLRFFDHKRYFHHAWVIMPNHVHTLTTLARGQRLEDVLHTWKSFTAKRINLHLSRQGGLWQDDYFDRIVRNLAHFEACRNYIRRNSVKAELRESEFTHFEAMT